VTNEQDLPSILAAAVQASASVDKSQISPSFLPVLADRSRYDGQNGLASVMPNHIIKHSKKTKLFLS